MDEIEKDLVDIVLCKLSKGISAEEVRGIVLEKISKIKSEIVLFSNISLQGNPNVDIRNKRKSNTIIEGLKLQLEFWELMLKRIPICGSETNSKEVCKKSDNKNWVKIILKKTLKVIRSILFYLLCVLVPIAFMVLMFFMARACKEEKEPKVEIKGVYEEQIIGKWEMVWKPYIDNLGVRWNADISEIRIDSSLIYSSMNNTLSYFISDSSVLNNRPHIWIVDANTKFCEHGAIYCDIVSSDKYDTLYFLQEEDTVCTLTRKNIGIEVLPASPKPFNALDITQKTRKSQQQNKPSAAKYGLCEEDDLNIIK